MISGRGHRFTWPQAKENVGLFPRAAPLLLRPALLASLDLVPRGNKRFCRGEQTRIVRYVNDRFLRANEKLGAVSPSLPPLLCFSLDIGPKLVALFIEVKCLRAPHSAEM